MVVQNNVQSFLHHWALREERLAVDFSAREEGGGEKKNARKVSVWPVMISTYWKNFVGIFLLGIAHYSLTFVNPQALKLLVNHVDNLVWN